ncbi:MAG: ABC transporter substrate-binding protein [Pseudomonadota bacterium]
MNLRINIFRFVAFLWLAACHLYPAAAQAPETFMEAPLLRSRVAAGQLPPIKERLPNTPKLIDLAADGNRIGRYGGRIRMLMGREKDIRMVAYYGYARLVGYNSRLELEADILERFDVQDGRQFTLHLRPGHKWSDGHPFTAEDFRFYWEDIANNKELSPGGVHRHLLVNDKPPVFEVLDNYTVRYTWDAPNPYFLSAIAGTRPLYIYAPGHFLKQFHSKYATDKANDKWASSFNKLARQELPSDMRMPTLEAWQLQTNPPSSLYEFARNPYFHRIDAKGQQLPYADYLTVAIGSNSLIPAKTGSGDSDLQGRYVRFDDYTFLKAAEKRDVIKVELWKHTVGSALAIYPNLNTKDEAWRAAFRDVNVRRALSLAINRREINKAIFFGLAKESANTVVPESPLFKPEYASAYSRFDLDEANRLLDQTILAKRGRDGIRLLPDGRRAELILETTGENTMQTDVLSLIRDSWSKIGILMYPRPTHRDLFRNRVYSGDTVISAWPGYDNGLATPDFSPLDFAPTSKQHYQWPQWGDYYWTKGRAGEAPDLPEARQLVALLKRWERSSSTDERRSIWHKMLTIHADQVFSIGTVNGSMQPVAHAPNLQNVPKNGTWSYEPSAYFGIYRPDTFWFAE